MRKNNWLFLIAAIIAVIALFTLGSGQNTVDPKTYHPAVYSTAWALLPPIIAIGLALITKEVYSSLFTGIIVGAVLYANGNLELMINTFLYQSEGGMVSKLSDSWNVGILIFLVILGIMVALMNKVGGSAAFGLWAAQKIRSRVGAQLATVLLGVLIFVDDYFNCLTVGSVMRPLTDRHKISRAKLAYLIDATAAPVCIIAPVSSWAAAVTSSVPADSGINGFSMFLRTIPYNFYALTTILMLIVISIIKLDYGPMKIKEMLAIQATEEVRVQSKYMEEKQPLGGVIDLIFPIAILIICCVIGMVYTGGYFTGQSFVDAFANADASKGLVLGSIVTLLVTFIWYMTRGVLTFHEFTECIPEGFKQMVAPILILTMAWTLSGMTGLLGAKFYVHDLVAASAGALKMFLPCIIFGVGLFLGFSTGTSWGTFAILIPIVCNVFQDPGSYEMLVISISACMAGAVCGDHCSPISDTTIMASAGAQCSHVDHVSTQLPYALTAAAVSGVGYLMAGILGYMWESSAALISLPITLAIMTLTLVAIKKSNI